MLKNVIIIGSGGHAKVVIDILNINANYKIIGCISKDPPEKHILNIPILGNDDIIPELFQKGITNVFIAIGENKLRLKLAEYLTKMGFNIINVISNDSNISTTVSLGKGIVVMPGASINVDTVISDYSIINTNSSVDHDCFIGKAIHIAPGSNLAGNVSVGEGSFLGIGCVVTPGISINEWTTVGAGSVVIKNLESHSVYVGNPAKKIK